MSRTGYFYKHFLLLLLHIRGSWTQTVDPTSETQECTLNNNDEGYTLIGCYDAFPVGNHTYPFDEADQCIEACVKDGFVFAGVEPYRCRCESNVSYFVDVSLDSTGGCPTSYLYKTDYYLSSEICGEPNLDHISTVCSGVNTTRQCYNVCQQYGTFIVKETNDGKGLCFCSNVTDDNHLVRNEIDECLQDKIYSCFYPNMCFYGTLALGSASSTTNSLEECVQFCVYTGRRYALFQIGGICVCSYYINEFLSTSPLVGGGCDPIYTTIYFIEKVEIYPACSTFNWTCPGDDFGIKCDDICLIGMTNNSIISPINYTSTNGSTLCRCNETHSYTDTSENSCSRGSMFIYKRFPLYQNYTSTTVAPTMQSWNLETQTNTTTTTRSQPTQTSDLTTIDDIPTTTDDLQATTKLTTTSRTTNNEMSTPLILQNQSTTGNAMTTALEPSTDVEDDTTVPQSTTRSSEPQTSERIDTQTTTTSPSVLDTDISTIPTPNINSAGSSAVDNPITTNNIISNNGFNTLNSNNAITTTSINSNNGMAISTTNSNTVKTTTSINRNNGFASTVNSPSGSVCPCPCSETSQKWDYLNQLNLTRDELVVHLKNELDSLKSNISIDPKKTSLFKNSKISVSDDRPSSAAVGAVGIMIISAVLALVVASDILTLMTKKSWSPNHV